MKPAAIQGFFLLPLLSLAAPVQLDSIWPAGGKRDSEIEIILTGKLDPWPCKLHFSGKGFTFAPDKEKKGSGKLKIASDAPVGPVIVRALSPDGVSTPHIFIVDELPEISEKDEDGNTISKAQTLDSAKLPLVVNGQLPGNNELDSFRLSLKKDETIHAAIEGYTIRSLIDPVLHVYDADGNRLALEHDGAVHLDPILQFTAPESGNYTIAVTAFAHPPSASVYFRGGKNAQYRLYLSREKEQLPKRLFPRDIGADSKTDKLALEKPVSGTLTKPNEVDSYFVAAKKGDPLQVRVEAATLGFPTDPVLRILKPDGSELKLVDDSNKESDPEYLWKVAADGDYKITVTDRFRRGGPDFRYQIHMEKPIPGFTATIEKSEYLVEPGKSVDIKVKVACLNDHKGNLQFEIPGLPPGVTLKSPEKVPEKGGDIVLKLEAKEDAPPFQKPMSIQVFNEGKEGKRTDGPKQATYSFKDDNYRGPYVVNDLSEVWLTIPPKKEPKEKAEKEAK